MAQRRLLCKSEYIQAPHEHQEIRGLVIKFSIIYYFLLFQQVQFVAIMVHAFQLLFIDCNYPRAFVWFIGMHAVMFFFLFNEFYKQAYQKKGRIGVTKATVQKVSSVLQKSVLKWGKVLVTCAVL